MLDELLLLDDREGEEFVVAERLFELELLDDDLFEPELEFTLVPELFVLEDPELVELFTLVPELFVLEDPELVELFTLVPLELDLFDVPELFVLVAEEFDRVDSDPLTRDELEFDLEEAFVFERVAAVDVRVEVRELLLTKSCLFLTLLLFPVLLLNEVFGFLDAKSFLLTV